MLHKDNKKLSWGGPRPFFNSAIVAHHLRFAIIAHQPRLSRQRYSNEHVNASGVTAMEVAVIHGLQRMKSYFHRDSAAMVTKPFFLIGIL